MIVGRMEQHYLQQLEDGTADQGGARRDGVRAADTPQVPCKPGPRPWAAMSIRDRPSSPLTARSSWPTPRKIRADGKSRRPRREWCRRKSAASAAAAPVQQHAQRGSACTSRWRTGDDRRRSPSFAWPCRWTGGQQSAAAAASWWVRSLTGVAALALALWLARRITRPLQELTDARPAHRRRGATAKGLRGRATTRSRSWPAPSTT